MSAGARVALCDRLVEVVAEVVAALWIPLLRPAVGQFCQNLGQFDVGLQPRQRGKSQPRACQSSPSEADHGWPNHGSVNDPIAHSDGEDKPPCLRGRAGESRGSTQVQDLLLWLYAVHQRVRAIRVAERT